MESDGEGIRKTFWDVELRRLNEGLPRMRKPLTEILKEGCPTYTNAGGEAVLLNRSEVEAFSKLVPPNKKGDVCLPIIIMKEASLKRGTYRIGGNVEEVKAVNAALNKIKGDQFIFRPDVLELSTKFPSLIAFGYTL